MRSRISSKKMISAAQMIADAGGVQANATAMRLVRTGGVFAQYELIRIFERAQRDCIREFERLKERDLVFYHIEGAQSRIERILSKMCGDARVCANDLIAANYISGRIGDRFKTKGEGIATALALAQGDERRVRRLVNQMMGKIEHAAACAQQDLNAKLSKACGNANLRAHGGATDGTKTIAPSIETGGALHSSYDFRGEGELSKQEIARLKANSVDFGRELERRAKERIKFFQQEYVIGRREMDVLRKKTLEQVAIGEAKGRQTAAVEMVGELLEHGVTCFIDRGGKQWTLPNYCHMTARTTAAQSRNVGTLFDDEAHDLYIVVPHQTSCPVCAPFEGRVFSRSGNNPYYPPLSDLFGKINPAGDNSLENTWLSIHPNCRHSLAKYIERAYTPLEVQQKRTFSNPKTNPYKTDPRTTEKVEEWKRREALMGKHNELLRMFRRVLKNSPPEVRASLPDFMTFKKRYIAGDVETVKIMSMYS